ncbi:MAG: hypothetical protein GQ469_04995 [Methanosarcinales archaeon]|nr:hypothetical protein [Methanosarcinales archaeon]
MTKHMSRWLLIFTFIITASIIVVEVGAADDGLVAEWNFEEGSGNTLKDNSGNGNDGTIYGATWTTDGKFGTALQFDGNDYIVIPDSPELSGGAGKNMTVEFWFNTNKQGGYIISKIRDVSYKDWSALIGGFGPGMNFWYENRGYDRRFYSGSILEEGVWHHGAFTFQRSTYGNNAVLKMYLDGNELPLTPFYQDGVPSNQLYDMPDTSAPVNIGYSGSYYNCCFFNGKIDEIKIFDRVLSADEIRAEYEKGGTTPTIIITSPNGGEEWQAGTTQTIQWTYTGNPGPGVEIEIFNSSGPVQTFTYVPIGSDGSGSYSWIIPENLAFRTDYQIRITIIGSAYSDTSGYFTISAPVSLSSSFLKPNYPSEVFTTGDLKYSILKTKGNGFTVKIYASVILPDNTIKYAYSDEWPLCFGTSTASLTCSLSPLLLSDVKIPLVEESIQIEDGYSVWNANEMTGDEPPGLYTWKIWYEDINNPGKILASSTASYIVSYSRPEILRLSIQEETKSTFQVSVDGQEYTVATLNHYIDPYTLKISETNNEVKVYLDMDGNPVKDGEISRKIGVVDYVYKLQKNDLKDELSQKQDKSLSKVEYTGNLPFVDWVVDTGEMLIFLPKNIGKVTFRKFVEELIVFAHDETYTMAFDEIYNNKEELWGEAIDDFLDANNNYFLALKVIKNDEDVLDYEKANTVLQNYLLGDFNYGMGQYILDNYYAEKGQPITFAKREFLKLGSFGLSEEVIAAAVSLDYDLVYFEKYGINQCDIYEKPYEATSYTLEFSGSSSNKYSDCTFQVYKTAGEIDQAVVDYFTNDLIFGILNSPGELHIYDSQNRVTGLVNGEIKEEIPNSVYVSEDETVIIYDAIDTYRYEVEGTEFGTYGLDLISFNNWDTISAFNAFDIPTTPGQNHQYDINWEMLFNSQNGVSIQIDSDGDGVFEQTIITGNTFYIYNITFLPPITTMDQFNLTDGSTLPIKFTVNHHITNEFIYDDTVNVTITNSTGHLITYFTNGTGTGSVRINSEEEQYIANFHTKDYAINIGETYSVTVTFGEPDSLRGYDITYFTLIEGGKAKGKGN